MAECIPSVREVSILLMNQSGEIHNSCGMLESGASRTVCGSEWLSQWAHPNSVDGKMQDSAKTFKFGDGRMIRIIGCLKLDAKVQYRNDTQRWVIHTDVIPGKLPLLISMSCVKSLGGRLGVKNGRLVTDSGTENLTISTSIGLV